MYAADFQVRDSSGVAIRRDGKGDKWANDHRKLGKGWNMRDSDETHRCVWEIEHQENRHWVDMVFDNIRNRGKLVRRCGTLCRSDRKSSVGRAEKEIEVGAVGIAHMLQECRNDKRCQGGHGGRAFLVCGEDYPYTYIELDPSTGHEARRDLLRSQFDWHGLYERLGLAAEKQQLEKWLLVECHLEEKNGR